MEFCEAVFDSIFSVENSSSLTIGVGEAGVCSEEDELLVDDSADDD